MKKRYVLLGIFIATFSISGLSVYLEIQDTERLMGSVFTRIGVAAALSAFMLIIYERWKEKLSDKIERAN